VKWFKHMTDMLDDVFIEDLINQYGPAGYGIWCGLLETYGKYAKENCGDFVQIPWSALTSRLHTSSAKLQRLLSDCEAAGKLSQRSNPKCLEIAIPKMASLRDDYGRKRKKVSGQTPDNVHLDTDKEEITKVISKETEAENVRFARAGEKYLAGSGNANMHQTQWAAGYLEATYLEIRSSRPEIPPAAILKCWQECCDEASSRSIGAIKWYKTAFENKTQEWKPGGGKPQGSVIAASRIVPAEQRTGGTGRL